jgi:hypothetical protein
VPDSSSTMLGGDDELDDGSAMISEDSKFEGPESCSQGEVCPFIFGSWTAGS